MSLEQPRYQVIYKQDGIEYRLYQPYLVAETIIDDTGDYRAAGNEGFRRLFRFITGANQGSEKIAMTAPVAQAPAAGEKIAMTVPVARSAGADGWRLAFMLPSRYSLDTAPRPTDPRIYIRAVPGRLVAVLRYSGRWTDRNFAERQTQLTAVLDAAGVQINGPVESAAYNGPFMPPFLRRNEVIAPITALPASAPADALLAAR